MGALGLTGERGGSTTWVRERMAPKEGGHCDLLASGGNRINYDDIDSGENKPVKLLLKNCSCSQVNLGPSESESGVVANLRQCPLSS